MELTRDQWNSFVIERGGGFLQSWEWGELQESIGKKIQRISTKDFVALFIQNDFPPGKYYLYSPHGPVFLNRQCEKIPLLISEIKKTVLPTKNNNLVFFRIDPNIEENENSSKYLRASGFKKTFDAQPQWTRILELNKNENELLDDMVAETRYAIRTAEKRGVTILKYATAMEKESNFNEFWSIFMETMNRSRLTPHSQNYFHKLLGMQGIVKTELHLAKLGESTIAANIFLYFGNSAIYLYAGSRHGYGKYNAPSFLLWNAIIDAKNRGFRTFDLWGISHSKKKWRGITAFKKGFGGNEINYLGAWDFPINHLWYKLYRIYKSVKR